MKKLVTAASVVFCAIIIFFSFFGEKLYYSTKPQVELDRPLRVNDTVESEQGFSAEILTVTRIPLTRCEPDETGYFGDGYVLIEAEGYSSEPTVIWASEALEDGQRVVEA